MMASAPTAEDFPVDLRTLHLPRPCAATSTRSTRLVERLSELASDRRRIDAAAGPARPLDELACSAGDVDDAIAAADEGLGHLPRLKTHHTTLLPLRQPRSRRLRASRSKPSPSHLRGDSVRAVTQMHDADRPQRDASGTRPALAAATDATALGASDQRRRPTPRCSHRSGRLALEDRGRPPAVASASRTRCAAGRSRAPGAARRGRRRARAGVRRTNFGRATSGQP